MNCRRCTEISRDVEGYRIPKRQPGKRPPPSLHNGLPDSGIGTVQLDSLGIGLLDSGVGIVLCSGLGIGIESGLASGQLGSDLGSSLLGSRLGSGQLDNGIVGSGLGIGPPFCNPGSGVLDGSQGSGHGGGQDSGGIGAKAVKIFLQPKTNEQSKSH